VRFLLLILLVACSSLPVGTDTVSYSCENGWGLQLTPNKSGARLGWDDGRVRDLYQVRSASGAKYATEQGLTPENGLIFWSKGREASFYEMVMDHTVPPESYDRITHCVVK
jgi:membrane-bound inhibitor of C-type lysozyme